MPVIRVQNFVSRLSCGDVVEVRCTDPGTRSDIPAWCRINGHEIVGIDEVGGEIVITVRVGETAPAAG
jgi:tRNA 2-thiouridine synthesizing protein A